VNKCNEWTTIEKEKIKLNEHKEEKKLGRGTCRRRYKWIER
jgi:hypothetical protein